MSEIYDNWERLVAATLRREQLWHLFHAPSRTPSISSIASDFSCSSQLSDLPFEFSISSSWYKQNSVPEIGVYGPRYNANDSEAKLRKDKKSQKIKALAPRDIVVNGKPLSSRELNMLLRCPCPPKKLGPGNYWYDKLVGFWGKQGQKPSQIISAELGLGGRLERHASNGNTLVYLNNREITKAELYVLQAAGVRCHSDTYLWMATDGSYQVEGINYISGNIWGKVITKLVCSVLSLPYPSQSSYTSRELSVFDHFEQGAIRNILLIGRSGSGTSTIFKQAKFLYKNIPFLEDELEQIKLLIQGNIYCYILILLEGQKRFEEENLNESRKGQFADEHRLTEFADANDKKSIYSFGPRLQAFSDWILHTEPRSLGVSFCAYFIQANAPLIEELWRNPAFQKTFMRRSELQRLHSVANYFLERAMHILKPDYEPSHLDILYAEGLLSSSSYMDFSFPPPHDDEVDIGYQQDFMIRYQLIRSKVFGANELPFELVGDVQIVILCISLSDYDQFISDDNGTSVNKMMHRECFKSMLRNPIFNQIGVLLLLTKHDLFEEKIKQIPLNICDWFGDFHPVTEDATVVDSLGEKGFYYISDKFKRLYAALTDRKLYVTKVNCLEQRSVDEALKYTREIMKWEEEMSEYLYTY